MDVLQLLFNALGVLEPNCEKTARNSSHAGLYPYQEITTKSIVYSVVWRILGGDSCNEFLQA